MTQEEPNRPQPERLKLNGKTTAIAVLDLSARCENPSEVCAQLMEPLAEFLETARKVSVPILYTISAAARGTRLGEVAAPSSSWNWTTRIAGPSLSSVRRLILQCSIPPRLRRAFTVTRSSSLWTVSMPDGNTNMSMRSTR
jgi:hypothetical protein